jgi:hypothetical protein
MNNPSPDELHTEADKLDPLSRKESEVMGRQTESHAPGAKPEDQTVYGEMNSVETEDQADVHSADWKDIV